MLRNFDVELDRPATRTVQQTAPAVAVQSKVTVISQPSTARAFLAKDDEMWTWQDLRDYVVAQIEQRFGVFPRNLAKESGIFKSFIARHGAKAPAIARYAFEVKDGFWAGAPIGVNRFCKGSDPYFAEPIIERLVDTAVQGW